MSIAQRLDPASIANLRLTCGDLRPVRGEAVEHVTVEGVENLQAAIEAYQEGGLTTLTIKASRLADEHLLLLKKLPRLERLNLVGCHRLTDAGLEPLRLLTALQKLDLKWCYELSGAGVQSLRNWLSSICIVTD